MNDPRNLLNDPNTTAAQLAEIAGAHPELAAQIAVHPNCYPALREWSQNQVAQQAQAAAQAAATQVISPETPAKPAMPAMPAMPAQQAASAQPAAPQMPAMPAQPQFGGQPQAPAQPQFQGQQQFGQQDPQFAQQGQQNPQFAQQAQFGQTPGYAQPQGQPGYGAQQAPAKKKTGLIVGIAAGAVIVLGGGTVGALALTGAFGGGAGGGADTPAAAITNIVSSVQDSDPLAVFGTIAPSEADIFADAVAELTKIKGANDARSYDELMADLKDAVQVELTNVETEEVDIAEDIVRVTLTDWNVKVDGDEDKVLDLMMEQTESSMREQYETFGYSESEIDDLLADQRAEMADDIDFPMEYSAADFRDESGSDLSVVSVKEDGKWYVSYLMTAADVAYQQGSDGGALGDAVLEAKKFDSPEEAAVGLTDAIESGDLDEIAQTMPLAERRVLSIYGPLLGNPLAGSGITFDPTDFSSEIVDGKGRITIDELGFADAGSISGLCFTSSYNDETNCLDDIPVLEKLGIADVDLIAVEENGGWLVGPLATVGDVAAIFAKNFVVYYNEDRLEELTEGTF